MGRRPIKARAHHASHWTGPALGLNQPVTGVKSALAPRPSNHIFAFSLVLFREPCPFFSPLQPIIPPLRALPPCPVQRTSSARASPNPDGEKKGPSRSLLTRAIRFDSSARGSNRNNHAASSLAIHSDSTIFVPIRTTQSRAPVAAASKGKSTKKKSFKLAPIPRRDLHFFSVDRSVWSLRAVTELELSFLNCYFQLYPAFYFSPPPLCTQRERERESELAHQPDTTSPQLYFDLCLLHTRYDITCCC